MRPILADRRSTINRIVECFRLPTQRTFPVSESSMSGPDAAEAIPLFGRTRSLDDIKHGMIRAKGVYDPRSGS
jgi:hypothetical protein